MTRRHATIHMLTGAPEHVAREIAAEIHAAALVRVDRQEAARFRLVPFGRAWYDRAVPHSREDQDHGT